MTIGGGRGRTMAETSSSGGMGRMQCRGCVTMDDGRDRIMAGTP